MGRALGKTDNPLLRRQLTAVSVIKNHGIRTSTDTAHVILHAAGTNELALPKTPAALTHGELAHAYGVGVCAPAPG